MRLKFEQITPRYDLNARGEMSYGDEQFRALKQSIYENGLIEPLIVYHSGDEYILIAGYRRYTAMKEIISEGKNIDLVPVELDHTVNDGTIREAILSRQLQNKSFTVSETSLAYKKLSESMSIADISARFGVKDTRVREVISYYEIFKEDPDLPLLVDNGSISLANLNYAVSLYETMPKHRKPIVEILLAAGGLPKANFIIKMESIFDDEEEPTVRVSTPRSEYIPRMTKTEAVRMDSVNDIRRRNSGALAYLKGKLKSEDEIIACLQMDLEDFPDEVSYVITTFFS